MLEGAIISCRNMLAPPSEGEKLFCRRFLHLQYPESRILAHSSEESAPCRKIPGATLAQVRQLWCKKKDVHVLQSMKSFVKTIVSSDYLQLIISTFLNRGLISASCFL